MYKYVYKGSDRAYASLHRAINGNGDTENEAQDEILDYVNTRYVSASESIWRIFSYKMNSHVPAVFRLAVHLPDQQSVTFHELSDLSQVVARASSRETTLTAWFLLNQQDPDACQFKYSEIPARYTFNTKTGVWTKRRNRQRYPAISRMYFVLPTDLEKYSLRLLLLRVGDAQSFDDLRTVDDVVHPTFRLAALARGLLMDNREWDQCLLEAAETSSSAAQVRHLFCIILLYCEVTSPGDLWVSHRDNLSEDYLHDQRQRLSESESSDSNNLQRMQDRAHNLALRDIAALLLQQGRPISSFDGIPALSTQEEQEIYEDTVFLSYDIEMQASRIELE